MYDGQERYTREVVDPLTDKEYTVNVYPYSWGYKYEVRDNEQGTVLQDGGMHPNITVAMEAGHEWIDNHIVTNRLNEAFGPERPDQSAETEQETSVAGGVDAHGRWVADRDYEHDDELER